jgi:C-terminal processing protease CtpA/Prc
MKRMLFPIALAFAVQAAFAAGTDTKAALEIEKKSPTAEAKAEAARHEMAELRTQMQQLSRRMAALSTELGDVGPRAYAFRYIGQPDRAMIGVVLAHDASGARISAVTPDGPAARAGLLGGDVITAIDGHALAEGKHTQGKRAGDDDDDGKLDDAHDRLAELKENQEVRIEYLRGKQKGVAVLKAERREALNWPALMNEDPEHPFLPKDFNERIRADVDRARREAERAVRDGERIRSDVERANVVYMRDNANEARTVAEATARASSQAATQAASRATARAMRHVMPWWGLNLAPVNADLGRYFGTDKGALVIAADTDSLPGLRAGDVITSVADEAVNRPEDVMRLMRDEPTGKDVSVKVMRDRKVVALNLKAPVFKSIFELAPPPPPPPPPAPPVPPAPPAPPVPPPPPAPPEPPHV